MGSRALITCLWTHVQATEDLYAAVDDRRQLLLNLVDGTGTSIALAGVGQPSPPNQSQLTLSAAAADEQVRKLVYLIENALAVLFIEFWRCLPPPIDAGVSSSAREERGLSIFVDRPVVSSQPASDRQLLGSDRDLDQLRRLLQPVLEQLAALGDLDMGRDSGSVQILSRRLKEFVVML